MATKTISLSDEAYKRLRSARRYPEESFSQVILRATWAGQTVTGHELLARLRDAPAYFSDAALDAMEEAKGDQKPPVDKWTTR
jgi:predicted CopG family antitoxin